MKDYRSGLWAGMQMDDPACLRFANGMIAAMPGAPVRMIDDATVARQSIPGLMDMLAKEGMTATVGYKGTVIIRAYPDV